MRRLAAVLAAVVVLAGGCSSDDDRDGAAPTTEGVPSTPSTSGPTTTGAPAVSCGGLGTAPASGGAEITFVEGGRLWAVGADGSGTRRCLIDGVSAEDGVAWGGGGDRVLVGNKVALADGKVEQPFPSGGLTVLSRPAGKSVLDVRGGKLAKRELGKDAAEISFLDGHEQTIYHPAGTHIVSIGRMDGRATLHIANNRGQGPQDLVKNETANRVFDPAFTASGALLFLADHGSYTELHRLEIDAGNFTTVERENSGNGMDHLVTSPFEGGGVAWGQGACDPGRGGRRLRAQRSAAYLPTEGTAVERGEPVAWTPDAALLVMVPGSCGDDEAEKGKARTLYRFKDGKATVVAEGVQAAAVRAVLPPPPAPPKVIPQQAPA